MNSEGKTLLIPGPETLHVDIWVLVFRNSGSRWVQMVFLVLKALNSPLLDIYFNLSFKIHVEYIFETNKFYKAKSAYKISITENSNSEIDDKIL